MEEHELGLSNVVPLERHPEQSHKERTRELYAAIRELGADIYDMRLPETHALVYVIHPDEHIQGIVFGRYTRGFEKKLNGRGALIATDKRVLLLDKKPMYVFYDEVIYPAVSGATYSRVGPVGTVTMHSKIGDIKVRTMNKNCARNFVEAVEAKLMNMQQRGA